MSLERMWAGWRSAYVSSVANAPADDHDGCVLCRLVGADDDAAALVLERTATTITVMNLYPYASGHLMVAPLRHEPDLDGLDDAEAADLIAAQRRALRAVRRAYGPDGVNLGVNLGRAAGAGVPGHLHVHVVPRWFGDTNFMTAVGEVRVMPEDLATGYGRLRDAWPARHNAPRARSPSAPWRHRTERSRRPRPGSSRHPPRRPRAGRRHRGRSPAAGRRALAPRGDTPR